MFAEKWRIQAISDHKLVRNEPWKSSKRVINAAFTFNKSTPEKSSAYNYTQVQITGFFLYYC